MSSILSFFVDAHFKRFFSDMKRIVSRRTKGVMLYSEEIRQIVYIRQSTRKQLLNKVFMRQYQERSIREMKRLMVKTFGPKIGKKLFSEADKLDVLVVDRASRRIWRYLWALNKLDNSMTYNRKTYHMVFERRMKTDKEMATVIYGALHNRLKKHLRSVLGALKEREQLPNGKAYGDLKIHIDAMKSACDKLGQHYHRLTGVKKMYDTSKLDEEFAIIIHTLGKSTNAGLISEKTRGMDTCE